MIQSPPPRQKSSLHTWDGTSPLAHHQHYSAESHQSHEDAYFTNETKGPWRSSGVKDQFKSIAVKYQHGEREQDATFDHLETFGSRWKSLLKLQTRFNHPGSLRYASVYGEEMKNLWLRKEHPHTLPNFFSSFISSTEGSKIILRPWGIPFLTVLMSGWQTHEPKVNSPFLWYKNRAQLRRQICLSSTRLPFMPWHPGK